MAEYIEREAVYELARTSDYYSDFHKSIADLTSLKELLEDAPAADVVEVVRCEKCLFYENVEYYHPTDKNPTKNVCRLFKRQMQPNDFCSYSERRTENDG